MWVFKINPKNNGGIHVDSKINHNNIGGDSCAFVWIRVDSKINVGIRVDSKIDQNSIGGDLCAFMGIRVDSCGFKNRPK